jgi:hypothetical protein
LFPPIILYLPILQQLPEISSKYQIRKVLAQSIQQFSSKSYVNLVLHHTLEGCPGTSRALPPAGRSNEHCSHVITIKFFVFPLKVLQPYFLSLCCKSTRVSSGTLILNGLGTEADADTEINSATAMSDRQTRCMTKRQRAFPRCA